MKTTATLFLIVAFVSIGQARPVRQWTYSDLEKEADFVAIVEVSDIQPTDVRLPKVPNPEWFQGLIATLKPLWVIKGDKNAKDIKFLFYRYSDNANAIPNGAIFATLEKGNRKQYLIFLKKGSSGYSPVSGDYDAGQSVHPVTQTL